LKKGVFEVFVSHSLDEFSIFDRKGIATKVGRIWSDLVAGMILLGGDLVGCR
jgi:hypothetical protein